MRTTQLCSSKPVNGRVARIGPGHLLALVTLVAPLAGTAAAASTDPTAPGWVRLETNLSVTPEILDTHWSSLVRAPSSLPDYSLAGANPGSTWAAVSHMPTLIDMGTARLAAGEAQTYVRPQFALGTSSDSLRGWLRFAGINASTCTAPLMKMHSSFAEGSSHAKVSLSARCSLH